MVWTSRTITIGATADTIWRAIAPFGTIDRYLPRLVACTVTRQGVGAERTLTSADGSTVVERLESLDEAAHRLSYSLLTDTPFRNCLTTMSVRPLGPGQAALEWSATFEPDGLPESEAVALLESVLAADCLALKRCLES